MNHDRQSAGQSLLEILIALTVFAVVVTAAALVFYGGSSSILAQNFSAGALDYARSGLEAARTIRDQIGCGSMINGTYGLSLQGSKWQFIPNFDSSGAYTRTMTVSSLDVNTKKIVASVAWQSEDDRPESIQLTEALSDWITTGSDLGTPSGDWTHPQIIASIDIGAGNNGTGLAYQKKKIYMAGYASSKNKPDIFIFDVSNPVSPSLQGAANIEEGLAAIAVSGSYAYAVEQDSPDFFTINVANPMMPLKVGKIMLPGGFGKTVALYGMYALVGTTNNPSGAEFFVVNVANPVSPTPVASIEIGSDVNVIAIRGSKAYITTSFDNGEMKIIDMTTPPTPLVVGVFDAPGADQPGITAFARQCGYAYLGRKEGAQPEFYVVDAVNPSMPVSLGSFETNSQVNGMVTAGTYAFLGTDDTNQEFKVLDMTNLSSIQLIGSINLPQNATGLVYNDNYVYISARSNDALKIITSSP